MEKGWTVKASISLATLLAFTIGLAVLLRVLNLGSREFWYDEVLSLALSTSQRSLYETPGDLPVALADLVPALQLPVELSFGDGIQSLRRLLLSLTGGEPHPPLFFLAQHVWLRGFGAGEAAMRSLNTLLSLAAIASTYGLGRLLLGHLGGLTLAALLSVNPFFLFHSLNVRMYAPLVLWATLSAWAMLHLTGWATPAPPTSEAAAPSIWQRRAPWFWSLILIASIAAGLMTFYLFFYWIITLAAIALFLDRRRWWQHGLRLTIGFLLTTPWLLWGFTKQLRNADLKRFNTALGPIATTLRHLQDVLQTLGNHLVIGDWATSLPPVIGIVDGIGVLLLLLTCLPQLRLQEQRRLVGVALMLGLLPMALALGVDILTGKFTVGFGWGRSLIFILPGCLLLLMLAVRQLPPRWNNLALTGLLLIYLSSNIADYSLRSRQIFHGMAAMIQPPAPTLIVMNSKAWGHVLRLAYYLPSSPASFLLAQRSSDLASSLQQVLAANPRKYDRVLWLDSAAPIWSPPSTEDERSTVAAVLARSFKLIQARELTGTMEIDQFTAQLYQRR
ncbi:hypothetical protein BST81_01445 [Leptolyngbya sp. 'hensonii']|uniref:glycosyltransferase family 39 protein n=1 Tax=Leptolyngbya sp. 'hensonii' TaxID=1922337 RepID=UPI0009502461|nr:glycosyltransferase family 39 protein [Leptolyngbya sp. 'hensonii']OLP20126.1 hypothetical protein BST81_01445 [Leptolyngbya sp. 'hensonii']